MYELLFTEDGIQYSVLIHDGQLVEMLRCDEGGGWVEISYDEWFDRWDKSKD